MNDILCQDDSNTSIKKKTLLKQLKVIEFLKCSGLECKWRSQIFNTSSKNVVNIGMQEINYCFLTSSSLKPVISATSERAIPLDFNDFSTTFTQ